MNTLETLDGWTIYIHREEAMYFFMAKDRKIFLVFDLAVTKDVL